MLMLICDEDAAIFVGIASALRARGLGDVVTARRLDEANRKIAGQDVGVAVIDINMKQDGALQFARELRSRGALAFLDRTFRAQGFIARRRADALPHLADSFVRDALYFVGYAAAHWLRS